MRAKSALVRLALSGDSVVIDAPAKAPGRGAYVCGRACLEQAIARRAFAKAFHRAVSADRSLLESTDLCQ